MHLQMFLQSQLFMNVRSEAPVYVGSNWVDCTNDSTKSIIANSFQYNFL